MILFAILLFSGIGSYVSGRLAQRWTPLLVALIWTLPLLVLLGAFYAFTLTDLLRAQLHLELPARILMSVLLIAPLGLLMGMPMPLGIAAWAAAGPS